MVNEAQFRIKLRGEEKNMIDLVLFLFFFVFWFLF